MVRGAPGCPQPRRAGVGGSRRDGRGVSWGGGRVVAGPGDRRRGCPWGRWMGEGGGREGDGAAGAVGGEDLGGWGWGDGGEAAELGPEFGAGWAGTRVLGQEGGDERGEAAGAAEDAGWVVDHCGEGGDRGAAIEGRFALDRVEHGRPQCPEVGRRAALLALGLLRGHIGGRPDHQTGRGELRVALERGDAEVGQLGRAVAGDHDVARLDVAMDDPGLVGRLQRAGDLGADLGHPPDRQRAVGPDQVGQGRRVDQLHHDEGAAMVL